MDDRDLVKGLVHRFQIPPQCLHLEWAPGVSPPDLVVCWVVRATTSWSFVPYTVAVSRPDAVSNVRVAECCCDLSGGNKSRDPGHLAYQEACLRTFKIYVSFFEERCRGRVVEGTSFTYLTESALLKHCRLDMELLSLCRTFFKLARGCLVLRISFGKAERSKENLLGWVEVSISRGISSLLIVISYHIDGYSPLQTFPEIFVAEGEALKVQFLGLRWEHWVRNEKQSQRNWERRNRRWSLTHRQIPPVLLSE